MVSEVEYMHHPRERKVDKDTQDEITRMVKLGANRKLIQQHNSENTGKLVTKKDIDNMSHNTQLSPYEDKFISDT
jgi:hypothetical protein